MHGRLCRRKPTHGGTASMPTLGVIYKKIQYDIFAGEHF